MKRVWRDAFLSMFLLMFVLTFTVAGYSQDDTNPIGLDDMLNDSSYQDGSGEDVSVNQAEKKVFAPLCVKNKIWLVADKECLSELQQDFTPKSDVIQVFSGSRAATGIEETLINFISEKKPDGPVLIMVKKARAMQTDAARLRDSEHRENLKDGILARIKREADFDLSQLASAKVPYITRLVDVTSAAKLAKLFEKNITDKSPLFIVPWQYTTKGAGQNQNQAVEKTILARFAPENLVKLNDASEDKALDTKVMTFNEQMMVSVGKLFTAPIGTQVIVVGAPEELGGISAEEFASLAVYFRVCRVWGSDPQQTVAAVKQFIDEKLEAQAPAAQAAQGVNEPEIFSQPVTGTVEVNTRLNMRSSPWGAIVGKLLPGSQISIVGSQDDWYIAEVNGSRVFIHKNYVSTPGNPASRQAPTPPANTNPGGSSTGSNPPVAAVPPQTLPPGSLNSGTYGYDAKRYGPIYDILEKYCQINQRYSNKSDSDRRYHGPDHWTQVTDCSGLVGHFIDKLADAAGMPSPIPRSWYPDSQYYRTNKTTKITSARPPTNPRDLIKPGDLFVLRREPGKYGHIGMFMGYTSSGQPIIAHSTAGTLRQDRVISGRVGTTGTRIEIMPSSYFTDSRWEGIFRLNAMDQMLDKLSS